MTISERNSAAAIGTIHAVRRARIELSHVPRRWSIRADTYLTVRAETPVEAPAPVAGGIPGFDRTGQEVIAGTFRVNDAPLSWDLHGRCGFATDFAYSSHDLMRRGRSGAAVRWLLALLVSTDRAGNITVSGSKTQGTTQLPPAPTADLPALRRRLESEALPTPGRHLATVTCPSSSTSTSAAAPDKVARQATAGR